MASVLKPRLKSLAEQCREEPSRVVGETGAVCSSTPGDPLHWTVRGRPSCKGEQPVGQHEAIGGDGTAPCPGELLSMALASCMDGVIRAIADLMEMELEAIRVEVVNRGDVRDFLRLSDMPPPEATGISMHVEVRAAVGEDPQRVAKLLAAAEQQSAVLNVVRNPVSVAVTTTALQ